MIISVCDDFGLLKEIFKFPLSPDEEEEFMHYLDECTNKDSGDLKIMYLLSRARYGKIFENISYSKCTKFVKIISRFVETVIYP